MTKVDKCIEIVSSTTKGLSSMNHRSREAACAVLEQHYSTVSITVVNDLQDLEDLVAREPDLVFLGMNFVLVGSDKVWVSEYLEDHDINYTGSGYLAHELGLNKHKAKQCVIDAGLKTSRYFVTGPGRQIVARSASFSYPLFVKPTSRGGGIGIDRYSVAHNLEQLESKLRSIKDSLQSDSLVEEYLTGREFSVAILKNEYTDGYSVMPLELVPPIDINGDRMLSHGVKTSDSEATLEVADGQLKADICALAINAFHALGGCDYGRIDIRLDATGEPHFLEANLLPSLISGYGSSPKACEMNLGLDYESMILTITRLALSRANEKAKEMLVI